MTQAPVMRSGEVLNATYRLERLIGSGGMGTVYEASHMRVPRKFAVKVLNPDAIGNRDIFERFQREAEIASALGHENIVQVFDFNRTPDGMPYMVLEYLEGQDLAHRLHERGRLSIEATTALLGQLTDALDAAHAGHIIHRDLKPNNVFLMRRGQRDDFVKVLDFGISKIVHASSTATRTGIVLGTPNYMAPEQAEARSQEMDHRTDIFALGAIAYECLTGRMAFDAPTPIGTMYQVCHATPAPIRAFAPEVSDALERVVLRAMAKRRDDRYSSGAALLADWVAATKVLHPSQLPTQPTPVYTPSPPPRISTTLDRAASQKVTPLPARTPRRRTRWIAAAVVACSGAIVGILALAPGPAPVPAPAPAAAPAPVAAPGPAAAPAPAPAPVAAPVVAVPVKLELPPPAVAATPFELPPLAIAGAEAAPDDLEITAALQALPAPPKREVRQKPKPRPKAPVHIGPPPKKKPNLGPVESDL